MWRKESSDRNAMYVDLFRVASSDQRSVEMQYALNKISKLFCKANGSNYKNDVTSNQHRQKGNSLFAQNRFSDAMERYNKSLCFAETNSETLGLAFSNRSACFLEMKMFKKCLTDIELAKNNKYPKHLKDKLNNRQNECLKLMEIENDQSEVGDINLDFGANEKFQCIANVVDIQTNDEFCSKTIMVEQCYFGVTKYDHYISCNICLKEKQNFIPCKKCASALFCCDCEENDIHKIECDINYGCPAGFKMMDVVRSVSLAKNTFSNADELIAFVEDMLQNNKSEMPSNIVDSKTKYRAFFKLCPDWQKYELHLQHAFQFYQSLLDQNDMAEFFRTEAHKRFLMHLVQHHISMILYGSFNKRTAPTDGVNITDSYVNIVARHFNHSCIPNVCHVFKDGSIIGIVIRPIKKNEQLFISYVAGDAFSSEVHRRAVLINRFINCKCERCELKSLPSNPQMQFDPNFKIIQKRFKYRNYCNNLYVREQINSMKEECFYILKKYEQMKWSVEMDYIKDHLSYLLSK